MIPIRFCSARAITLSITLGSANNAETSEIPLIGAKLFLAMCESVFAPKCLLILSFFFFVLWNLSLNDAIYVEWWTVV